MHLFINIAHKIGMDKSIAYSSGSRIVQGFTGVLSVLFITTFLTGIEQGYYYTFGSLLALQVFFELGLTGIMTQFVAHEVSHLTLVNEGIYEGDVKYKSRLASLVHFCVKWYGVLAILTSTFLMIVGYLYFSHYGNENKGINWQAPWFLICLSTGINIFQSPFISIFMGLGKVKEMSKIGFWQQILVPITIWTGLACGMKLFVVGIGSILSLLIWLFYVWKTDLVNMVLTLWRTNINDRVSYTKEIFPYQWRIALSWVSGYFIFQLFNPFLFATEGAVVAGQMGMTLQALNAISALSFSWFSTKIPLFSKLIALKDYVQLDIIYKKTHYQLISVCIFLLSFFFIIIWVLNISQLKVGNNVFADRFLPYVPMLLMMISILLSQFVSSWANYLRCHKKEPFLAFSIVSGIACCLSTIIFGKLYGLYGITIGFLIIKILMLPWGYWVYKTKKEEWHNK